MKFMNTVGCPLGQRLFTYRGYVTRTYCNRWDCPVCRKRLAHHWAQNVYYGWCLWRPRPFYFHTYTMPGWMTDPAEGYAALPGCWDNLRKTITRTYGWFTYAAFCEEQPKQRHMVHLHVITLTNLPTRLNEIALHAGFGYQAKNELVSGLRAAWYVTKYASKNLLYAPSHFRRVRISQAWPKLPGPILPRDYIRFKHGEPLKAYLHRVSAETGIDISSLTDLYDNLACDIVAN